MFSKYLDGLTNDMPDEFHKLAQVFELNVFQPITIDGEKDIHAAYLMNDAVESYFVFENSVMTGTYKDIECEQMASIDRVDDDYMLIVNQGNENIFTIRFARLGMKTVYFDYGCMGHFWVKGYEYLRQLEYQLADVRDKLRYLGRSSCTDKEMIFAKLADFPPIKRYKSVPDMYYVPYPDNVAPEAATYLIGIANDVGDRRMAGMLAKYLNNPISYRCRIIAAMLHRKSHSRFVDRIIMDLREAAKVYETRHFTKEEEERYRKVHRQAEAAMNEFKEKGFNCMLYREEPFMYSKDSITYKEHVMVFKNGIFKRKCEIHTFEV